MSNKRKLLIVILIVAIIGYFIGWTVYGVYYGNKTSTINGIVVEIIEDTSITLSHSIGSYIKRDTFLINKDSIINTEPTVDKKVTINYYLKDNIIKDLN